MYLIDSHTHLTDSRYQGLLDELFERSRQAGVDEWITVGTNLADSHASIELARQYENLHCTAGVHPHDAAKQTEDFIVMLEGLAASEEVCAIGEVGLDYHYDFSDPASQQRILSEQLQLAAKLGLPVVFHCRESFDDSLAILDEHHAENLSVVFHCYSGTKDQARLLLDRGWYLSFTGTITFKNAAAIQNVVRYVPLDRVMLETDCPYLSPEPVRKIKTNEPALLVHTAQQMATLKNLSLEKIAQATTDNCRYFFKLNSMEHHPSQKG